MADTSFGVKELNLISGSGTPTIQSPSDLNLIASKVDISSNAIVGGALTATSFVKSGGTSSQYLMANGTTTTGGGALSTLTDTTITSAAKNQTLLYDNSTSKWRNITTAVANVKDFGALGDGSHSTDDRQAIQDAIDSLSTSDGGVVFFPPGIYMIGNPLELDSADHDITLKGCSTHFSLNANDGSIIRLKNSMSNAINVTNCMSVSIENLRIDTNALPYKPDGIAINCESSTNIQGVTIDQVHIYGYPMGINMTGYSASAIRNTEIRNPPNIAASDYGIKITRGSDIRVDQIRLSNIIIDAVDLYGAKNDYMRGIFIGGTSADHTNTIWMYDVAVLRCKIGIEFDSTLGGESANTGAFFRLQNCDVDQNKEDGIYINGGTQIWIDNPYLSSNGHNGLETGGSFKGTLWITNADCRGNGYHGMAFEGALHKKIHITSPHCAVNSQAQNNNYHGINVATGGDDIIIQGGQCGGDVYGGTTGATTNTANPQSYGIMFIGNNHKRIQITGVDCTDNQAGTIGWQTLGDNVSASSYNFIQSCAGYSTGQTTFP